MANNQYVNKVVNGESGDVLIDLTADTITASSLMQGYTAHDKSGAPIVGTATGGGTEAGTVTQDQDGYLVLDDEAGSGGVTVESLSVTQNGTYTAPTGKAYSPITVSVSGGGGGGGSMSDPIRFFDYDGTLVASYSAVPSSLPSVPTHNKLTNGTWNYTLQQVTTQFNAMGTCDVGANYDTVSGATEIDIVLQEGRLHPYLSLAVNGSVTIDWGDNSTDTATGTSLTTRLSTIHHEYAAAGSYTIKITKTSGTGYALYCSSTYPLLNKNTTTANSSRVYSNGVKAVRVGDDCTIGTYAFYMCYSLESVSIPSSITSIGSYAFSTCHSLDFVSIPSEVTSIDTYAFYTCSSLEFVSIPSGVTSIGNSAFSTCSSLKSFSIPSSITSIGSGVFNTCNSLAHLSFGGSLSSIEASAFTSCYGMAEYHFKPTTPPTLANTNAFNNIQSDCKIYVPAASLDTYKTANNWSTYASKMVGE